MCGIFGIYGHPEASNLTYLGLHALQHRGQESAGISASDGEVVRTYRGMGLVVDVFDEERLSADLAGHAAIGHVRYSTAGDSEIANAQPIAVRSARGQLALSHNGNLVNEISLRRELEGQGSIFSTNADSEVLMHLIARSDHDDIVDRISQALTRVRGAFSLLFMTRSRLVAARDSLGFRPLVLGRVPRSSSAPSASAYVLASETSAFNLIGAEMVRMVEPGEILTVSADGLRSRRIGELTDRDVTSTPSTPPEPEHGGDEETRFCCFEHIYFARPDSQLGDRTVYFSRKALGRCLAREQPASADVVIAVPDSGTAAALGYAEQLGLPYELGLIRSHYVGRTFIEPSDSVRHFGVRLKLAPVREVISGRRVVVVDDSLVRGTTSQKIVAMLRQAGAAEVHLRISAPPTRNPCPYGIDTPTKKELIANDKSVQDIERFVGADSLGYISLEGMLEALGGADGRRYCDACFSGKYPVAFEAPEKRGPLPQSARGPGR
ncbi:MAG: amidophosphoribosyltransferase [Myxococcales bacterium]|nr:amidophosphoribosyltransferase [Myxococcales bacterium]